MKIESLIFHGVPSEYMVNECWGPIAELPVLPQLASFGKSAKVNNTGNRGITAQ